MPSAFRSSSLHLPQTPLFFTSSHKSHHTKSIFFASLQFSSKNKSSKPRRPVNRICSSYAIDQEILDKKNSRSRVQDWVGGIKSLPTSQKSRIVDLVAEDGGFRSVSELNDLLTALITAGELESATKLYCSCSSSSYGFVPDSRTYSTMINCFCKKNEPEEARKVLDSMVENEIQPNVAMVTTLIHGFCKKGRLQRGFEVFRFMGSIGCEPTINTYNCLLKGLCYVGKVEEAYELLKTVKKSSLKPDVYTYAAVMDGFCKVGRSNEASELLDEALEMGITPNVVIFNTLFNGYFKEGTPLEGIHLLNRMKQMKCVPDFISYSTLFHGLLKWGEFDEAMKIYREMVEIGFDVDERMMNTLLRGLCRRSRTEKKLLKDAHQLFDEMTKRTNPIYPSTYQVVIESFCWGKDIDRAMASLHGMIQMGYSPRKTTFNKVVEALCVEGEIEKAVYVLILMSETGQFPGKIHLEMIVDELNRHELFSGACNIYGSAVKRGMVLKRKPGDSSTEKED